MLMPDKTHTTNYTDTFIEIAADSNQMKGEEPPLKEQKSVARLQYELLANHPYQYTSDDVLFEVFAQRHHVPKSQREAARSDFSLKGKPVLERHLYQKNTAGGYTVTAKVK